MLKSYLALQYFPEASNTRNAIRSLNRWIERCQPLHEALLQMGVKAGQQYLPPEAVRLIYHYLGEP
jgi:hypothetical protein